LVKLREILCGGSQTSNVLKALKKKVIPRITPTNRADFDRGTLVSTITTAQRTLSTTKGASQKMTCPILSLTGLKSTRSSSMAGARENRKLKTKDLHPDTLDRISEMMKVRVSGPTKECAATWKPASRASLLHSAPPKSTWTSLRMPRNQL